MSAIQTEFGGSNPISLSEYYKGGSFVSAGATDPNTIPTSGTITIGDFRGASQALPTVTISAVRSTTSVNEGSAFTFSASASTAITGTVDFTLTGSATDGSDYNTSGASTGTTGSFTFSNSTTSNTLTVTTVADSTTEGSENVICTISNPNVSGYTESIGTASRTVTINDTSTTPTPTYAFSAGSYTVLEGSSESITVNTTNVSNGTTLYWSLASDPGNDIVTDSGSFTISSNSGSFTVSAASDSNNESTETLTLQLRTGSTSGTIQDTASLNIQNVANINLTPATDTLPIVDEDGTVSAAGGIQLEGTSSADTYNIGTIIDGFQSQEHSNVWITGGDPADYEARVTVTSGTVNSNVSFTNNGTGTSVGSWITLSGTNYLWIWQTTSELSNTFTITLEIRDSATQTVQDSATVELNFETVFVPA